MSVATLAPPRVRFHFGLNVADLGRSVEFYRLLFDRRPSKQLADYAKFELDDPPLVLGLHPHPPAPGGALNHVGIRLPDSAALVAVQRRLEEAGVRTEREDGVECCYALQTKFWVTDPDLNLWEIYVLHEDLDHSGFGGNGAGMPPKPSPAGPKTIWEHRLTDPWPAAIPAADASVDEVRLEGSFNTTRGAAERGSLLKEALRVLKPGGVVAVHGLVGDRPFPGTPALPGPAGMVQRIPVETETLDELAVAGFEGLFFEKLGDIHCFRVGGVELRELRLVGSKPSADAGGDVTVDYKGPLRRVTDETGAVLVAGVPTRIPASAWRRIEAGPAGGQFVALG